MTASAETGRPNQRRRTRKDLLGAAARLLRQGRTPTLEDIAEEALVSRATAYRYFPNLDALLLEAGLDVALPDPGDALQDAPPTDPVARLDRVDAVFEEMISANEAQLRLMLAKSLERVVREGPSDGPVRQNRRADMIAAALEPSRKQFRPKDREMLQRALALIVGTESMVVFRDVLCLDDGEARKVRRWAIRALVAAALR